MVTARNTSRRRGQKINACCISAPQGNCSHRIRRKTATPEATFFVFLFHFHLFTTNVIRALSLEAIKGEVGATSRDNRQHIHTIEKTMKNSTHTLLTKTSTHTHHPSKETWDPLPLLKACNPYYEHSGARQHEQQQNPLDVGLFMPELV
jgi:hypothetical protein